MSEKVRLLCILLGNFLDPHDPRQIVGYRTLQRPRRNILGTLDGRVSIGGRTYKATTGSAPEGIIAIGDQVIYAEK